MPRAPRRVATLAATTALALLAIAPIGLPASHSVRAADRGLVVIAQTRYLALPEERRIHVTIDAVATSYTPNPVDGLSYYPEVGFAAPPGATSFTASSGGQALAVAVDSRDPDFTTVNVTFADGVFYQESETYRVGFDLPDPGGAPDRDFRISPSIVAFPIWVFGTSGERGSSVSVVLPAGFRPNVQGASLTTSTGGLGEVILSSGVLLDPFDFVAYLAADRPGAFTDTQLTVAMTEEQARVQVRAWQDDPEWGAAMITLMTGGLPELEDLIGLSYPAPGKLIVEEAATSRLGEYAGIYNTLTGIIRVRYDADAFVGLHEAAHIWFNSNLLGDRWIGEAWAEFYGVQAAKALGLSGAEFELTDEMLVDRIALNDWGGIGAVETGVEEYAYAASYHVAGLIFGRTDIAGLQTVWRGVDGAEMAYQPAHGSGGPESGVPHALEGWQQLLDLLDERAGASFDDLWTEWIVNDEQQLLIQDRTAARAEYAEVAEEAGEWNLPTDLRSAMGSWDFDQAVVDLGLATEVLAARDEIESAADDLGLTPPATLQASFEGDGGLARAIDEAELELEVLAGIAKAMDRLDDEESLLETVGLLGADPDARLDRARAEFEADQMDDAGTAAAEALATRQGADSAGRTRTAIGGGGLAILTGGALVGMRLRRRRRSAGSDMPDWPTDPPAA